jgi:hypothetical protein
VTSIMPKHKSPTAEQTRVSAGGKRTLLQASGGRKSPVSGIVSQAVKREEQWADAHRSPKNTWQRILAEGCLVESRGKCLTIPPQSDPKSIKGRFVRGIVLVLSATVLVLERIADARTNLRP